MSNFFSSKKFILFVASRFSSVDRKSSGKAATVFSVVGIALGVLSLIVVLSVMNGFQHQSMNSILTLGSYHVQVQDVDDRKAFEDFCSNGDVTSVTPFYEETVLLAGNRGVQSAAKVRAVERDMYMKEKSFKEEMSIVRGYWNLDNPDFIILGSRLANEMQASIGSKITIVAMSGASGSPLISTDRVLTVSGIFHTGYSDLNSSLCFISSEYSKFVDNSNLTYGITLRDRNLSNRFVQEVQKKFPQAKTQTWQSMNRVFFGALKNEKNIMIMVVFLIFVVVGVNIYNSMRRIIFERSEEIAVLSSLGATRGEILSMFMTKGFAVGFIGTAIGLAFGILMSLNMDHIFLFISKALYGIQYGFMKIFMPSRAPYLRENPMFRVYASIPAIIQKGEVVMICVFGILSSFVSSILAGIKILKIKVAEILRNE